MLAKILKLGGIFFIPPVTVFPLLSYQDKGLKVVTIEGSGSLFEPILLLTKEKDLDVQISVLPTGSTSGKESLNNQSAELALTSLSSLAEQSSTKKNFKEARMAEDPIVLVHKKNTKCQLFQSQNNQQDASEILKKLFESSNHCNQLVIFLREGGNERSNLNKTILKEDKSLQDDLQVTIKELPENNFLAFEKFQREELDSVVFFPSSFTELNKETFSSYTTIKLGGQTIAGQGDSPKLKKELSLLFQQGKINDPKSLLKKIITNILLKTQKLNEKLNLQQKNYCEEKQSEKCSQGASPKVEQQSISELWEENTKQS